MGQSNSNESVTAQTIEDVRSLLVLLKQERCDDYNDWSRVLIALAQWGDALKHTAHTFSMRAGNYTIESFEHQWERALDAAKKHPESGFETLAGFAMADDPAGFKNLADATEKADTVSDAESTAVGEALEKFMNDGTQNEALIGDLIPKEKTEIIEQLHASGRYNIKVKRVPRSDVQTSSPDESVIQLQLFATLNAAIIEALNEAVRESEPDEPEKTPSMYCNSMYCFTAGCTDPSHIA